ncbi:hypothetical protein [Novosphingobium sp. Chol11]|uniref:hypothetical protein n=1 Tax=Novosphingobium sp. Chol11 TaxID=1385763 RepID=UPI00114312BD|nr:hypothetical protein [Novosphingobium sp. Chol11]
MPQLHSRVAALLLTLFAADGVLAQTEPVSGSWSCWNDRKGDRYCRTTSTVRMSRQRVAPRTLPPRPIFRAPPPVFNPVPLSRVGMAPPIQTVPTSNRCPRTYPQRSRWPARQQVSPGPKVIDVEATLRARDGRPVCR